MIPLVSEEPAKVGQSATLILDTKYQNLIDLNTLRIYYKLGSGATQFKTAVVVETTKLQVAIDSTELTSKGKLRAWTYARGIGTIVMKGYTFIIPVIDEDG